jgi:O-antigen biosynthesis protein
MTNGNRLALKLPQPKQGGWFLLEAQLQSYTACGTRVYFASDSDLFPPEGVCLPATLRGIVREVIMVPPGVRDLVLESCEDPPTAVSGAALRRLSGWQRFWQMQRRVATQLWRQPRSRRRSAGLSFWRMLFDIEGAYECAGRLSARAAPPSYEDWVAAHDVMSAADIEAAQRHIATWAEQPFFHVLLVGSDEAARSRTIGALAAQIFRGFTCVTVEDLHGDARVDELVRSAGPRDWVLVLRAGDTLAPHALYWLGATALACPEARLIYGDEDRLLADGQRAQPEFKPDWSWAHALSTPFIGRAFAMRGDELANCGGFSELDTTDCTYDAVLRLMAPEEGKAPAAVRHIPAVLLHRSSRAAEAGAGTCENACCLEAVRRHLTRCGTPADIEASGGNTWRVKYPLPSPAPSVTIIVPTRDALALTRRCLQSIRDQTRYPDYEVLLVDNQSADPEALAWMAEEAAAGRIRLLRYDAPFNYSAINNLAVRESGGELVCLLNNDTEVIHADWLQEMVTQLLRPRVDVVGAKLLYPDGRVQHAGDLVGVGGIANHAHAWLDGDAPGYCGRAIVAQEFSAVTGACLLTRRSRYLELGGLDERKLPVAFSDIDYCLRVREAGGRVVWTPHAKLVHHESVSRGKDSSWSARRRAWREASYMRRRWTQALGHDPFYNPNLNHMRADFSLGPAPVVRKPWET